MQKRPTFAAIEPKVKIILAGKNTHMYIERVCQRDNCQTIRVSFSVLLYGQIVGIWNIVTWTLIGGCELSNKMC